MTVVAVVSSSFPAVVLGFATAVVPAALLSVITYEATGVDAPALTLAATEYGVVAPVHVTAPFIPEQGVVAQKPSGADGVELETTPALETEKDVLTVAVEGDAAVCVHATLPVAETLIEKEVDDPCVTVTSFEVPSISAVTSSAPEARTTPNVIAANKLPMASDQRPRRRTCFSVIPLGADTSRIVPSLSRKRHARFRASSGRATVFPFPHPVSRTAATHATVRIYMPLLSRSQRMQVAFSPPERLGMRCYNRPPADGESALFL